MKFFSVVLRPGQKPHLVYATLVELFISRYLFQGIWHTFFQHARFILRIPCVP